MTSLVKKIDAETAKNSDSGMCSFVIFCSDKEGLEDQLKDLAKKEKLKKISLSIVDSKAGPRGYDINPDAEVTVFLYTSRTVKANHAFKKGELKAKDVDKIVGDVSKIVSKD